MNLGIFQFALLVCQRRTSACLICPALAEVVDYLQSPTKTSSMRDFVRPFGYFIGIPGGQFEAAKFSISYF